MGVRGREEKGACGRGSWCSRLSGYGGGCTEVRGSRTFVCRRRRGKLEREARSSSERTWRCHGESFVSEPFEAAEEARAARIRGADGTKGKSHFLLFLYSSGFLCECECGRPCL